MRTTLLALLLAAGAGCWYDRPNPWKTESDREDQLEQREQTWLLELREHKEPPTVEASWREDAALEGWRDTVLANAEPGLLPRMREQSAAKLSALEGMVRSHGAINENNKEQITESYRLWRLERRRLELIDARMRPRE
jgi:hypothetical protein